MTNRSRQAAQQRIGQRLGQRAGAATIGAAPRPSDTDLLVPAIDVHRQQFGRPPRLVTADAGFVSLRNEVVARERGG